jgi:hypothetical protein
MNDQAHPVLHDIPIGIDTSRFDEIVNPRKMVGHGVGGS